MWEYRYSNELYHYGILGMKWGKRNGPPYPLSDSSKSSAERKAEDRSVKKSKKAILKKFNKLAKSYNKEYSDLIFDYHNKMQKIEDPDTDYNKADPWEKIAMGQTYADAIMVDRHGLFNVNMMNLRNAYRSYVSGKASQGSKRFGLLGAAVASGKAVVEGRKKLYADMDELAITALNNPDEFRDVRDVLN